MTGRPADAPMDEDQIHTIGLSVQTLFERYRTPELAPAIMLLYDLDPCAFCREALVERLLKLDALPGWMREECAWDSNPAIRAAVGGTAIPE